MPRYSQAAVKQLLTKLTWDKYKVDATAVTCKICARRVNTITNGSAADKSRRDQELARLAEHTCFEHGRAA